MKTFHGAALVAAILALGVMTAGAQTPGGGATADGKHQGAMTGDPGAGHTGSGSGLDPHGAADSSSRPGASGRPSGEPAPTPLTQDGSKSPTPRMDAGPSSR